MPKSRSKVAQIQAESMHIPLGTPLLIEPQGLGERFKSTFIGMDRNKFLISRIPRIPGVNEHLYADKSVTVRYLNEGNVYGFETKILTVAMTPFRLLFLQYPYTLETLNLRGSQRLDCYLPASIKLGDTWSDGMILNISAGGCQLVAESKGLQPLPPVSTDDQVMLEFKMFGTDQPIMIGGTARNVNLVNPSRMTMGVKFDELSEYAEKIISDYLRSVAEYLKE